MVVKATTLGIKQILLTQGQTFYVYEILDGWARVHGESDNYWVWHERLRITKVY